MAPPIVERVQGAFRDKPPAFTAGLIIFLTFIFLLQQVLPVLELFRLTPNALTSLDLNRLSFYPVVHTGFVHFVLNVWCLFPLVRMFELRNGTVRTGIVLNVLAVFPGIAYCIISMIFRNENAIAGTSGWWFSLLGYFCLRDSVRTPTIRISSNFSVPLLIVPLFALVMTGLLVSNGSFTGHFIALIFGALMEQGYLAKLIEPSTNAVVWIEDKLAWLISKIPFGLNFISELNARDIRAQEGPSPLPFHDPSIIGTRGSTFAMNQRGSFSSGTQSQGPPASFQGEGHTLA